LNLNQATHRLLTRTALKLNIIRRIYLNVLFTPPINQYLSQILSAVCIVFMALCILRFWTAYRLAAQYGASRWFIRGIRCLLIALTVAAWSKDWKKN
jgi:hypothetical protein